MTCRRRFMECLRHAMSRKACLCGPRQDRDVPFQGVHDQLADGIDLIGIGVLQSFPPHVLVGFSQNAPQKGQLLLKAPHHGVLSASQRARWSL